MNTQQAKQCSEELFSMVENIESVKGAVFTHFVKLHTSLIQLSAIAQHMMHCNDTAHLKASAVSAAMLTQVAQSGINRLAKRVMTERDSAEARAMAGQIIARANQHAGNVGK